jgi:hypothetical protein
MTCGGGDFLNPEDAWQAQELKLFRVSDGRSKSLKGRKGCRIRRGWGELGFEPEFSALASHCSGVGNHCFSSDFFKNRTD